MWNWLERVVDRGRLWSRFERRIFLTARHYFFLKRPKWLLAARRRDSGIDVIAYDRKTHGRWTIKDERYLIALAISRTPLEVVAVIFNRSVDSLLKKTAAMEISLPSLDGPRPKIGLKAKGSKIAWIDVDRVSKAGEYGFRDGIIRIKHRDLEI